MFMLAGPERINLDDHCSCLSGVAGGYKSFFVRAGNTDERLRDRMTRQAGKVRAKLNRSKGCDVPNKVVVSP